MKQRCQCPRGHVFFKSSDCRSCPKCEAAKKPADGFLAQLAAPARRALTAAGLTTLKSLARRTEAEVIGLHGMGPNAVDRLRVAMKQAGLAFAKGDR